MVQHVILCDRSGVGVTEHDHAQGVADEDEIDAGLINEAGAWVVISGEGGDFVSTRFGLAEVLR
jgi:hypothetical protein